MEDEILKEMRAKAWYTDSGWYMRLDDAVEIAVRFAEAARDGGRDEMAYAVKMFTE